MSDIRTAERDVYEEMWGISQYAEISPGEQLAKLFDGIVRSRCEGAGGTVLDAGCGSGKGALALKALGYTVEMCDLTPAGLAGEAREIPFFEAALWDDLLTQRGFVDWVYCVDVLEHLPTALIGLAVYQMLKKARRGVFISVSLQQDVMGVWAGRPLHLTVQPFDWWRDMLREVGRVTDARDRLASAAFVVEPF